MSSSSSSATLRGLMRVVTRATAPSLQTPDQKGEVLEEVPSVAATKVDLVAEALVQLEKGAMSFQLLSLILWELAS